MYGLNANCLIITAIFHLKTLICKRFCFFIMINEERRKRELPVNQVLLRLGARFTAVPNTS